LLDAKGDESIALRKVKDKYENEFRQKEVYLSWVPLNNGMHVGL